MERRFGHAILSSSGGLLKKFHHHLSLLRIHAVNHGFKQLVGSFGTGTQCVGKGDIEHKGMPALHVITGTIQRIQFGMMMNDFFYDGRCATDLAAGFHDAHVHLTKNCKRH